MESSRFKAKPLEKRESKDFAKKRKQKLIIRRDFRRPRCRRRQVCVSEERRRPQGVQEQQGCPHEVFQEPQRSLEVR